MEDEDIIALYWARDERMAIMSCANKKAGISPLTISVTRKMTIFPMPDQK